MRIYTDYKRKISPDIQFSTASSGVSPEKSHPAQVVDTPSPSIQNYLERIVKLIPGEVIIIYPIISGLMSNLPNQYVGTSLSGLIAIALTWFLRTFGLEASIKPQISAILISTIACLIWVYHENGYIFYPLPQEWHNLSTVLLILFVVVTAKIAPGEKRIIDNS